MLMFLATVYLPAFLVCGMFYFAGRDMQNQRVGKWLRVSAIAWLVTLWTWFSLMALATQDCSGNMLYGYGTCGILPISITNLSLPVFLLLIGTACLYGLGLAICAFWVERRFRRLGH